MTPREVAESTDPEVLRDTLRRATVMYPPDSQRKRIIEHGTQADLVELGTFINSRLPTQRRIKHGLLP